MAKGRVIDEAKLVEMMALVEGEVRAVAEKKKPFNSAHEGWAIMYEEVDELWEEVRKKNKLRDPALMRAECKQIAAAAIRFMLDLT